MELRCLEYCEDKVLRSLVLMRDGSIREVRLEVGDGAIPVVSDDSRLFDLEPITINHVRSFVTVALSFSHAASGVAASGTKVERLEEWARSHLPTAQKSEVDPPQKSPGNPSPLAI